MENIFLNVSAKWPFSREYVLSGSWSILGHGKIYPYISFKVMTEQVYGIFGYPIIYMMRVFTVLVFLTGCICFEMETLKSVIMNTFGRNSSDVSFSLDNWATYLQSIGPLDVNSKSYDAFFSYDLNADGRVQLDEFQTVLKQFNFHPELRTGPKQIHIGLTRNNTEMQVMWVTQPEKEFRPIVRYGLRPLKLVDFEYGEWNQYNVGHVGFHGRIYRAVMKRLQPGQRYYYQVGDLQTNQFSEIKTFKAAPLNHLDRVNFAVFGDMGTVAPLGFSVSNEIVRTHLIDPLDFVLLTGDVAYAGMNSEKIGEMEPIWDLFGQITEKWAAVVPFMPGVGNHEKYYNYTAYQHRYYLPRSEGSGENLWFSFEYGQVHIAHISSEHPYTPGSPQYNFLEKDLEKAAANPKIKWIIVGAHRPFYAVSSKDYNEKTGMAKELTDLVQKYGVDIIQTGHMHCYERTWPVLKGKALKDGQNTTHYVKPGAPIYVVQGTAGALSHQKWIDPLPEWSMKRISKYGFGKIVITGNVLKYQFVSIMGGTILDEWYIMK